MPNNNAQIDLSVTAEIKLYYDLHLPEQTNKAPLLIAVHGYGAHKRYMMREAKLIAPENFAIVSLQAPHQHFRQMPDGGYRVGFGWLTDNRPEESVALHHKFIFDVIDRLDTTGIIDRKQIYMYGFSQACALNFRFAFTYPQILRGLIGVCGGIPGDLESNPAYKPFDAETFYIYNNDDEFYTQEQFAAFDRQLSARLPNYRSKQYEAKHEITEEMRKDMSEFMAGLV